MTHMASKHILKEIVSSTGPCGGRDDSGRFDNLGTQRENKIEPRNVLNKNNEDKCICRMIRV